LNIVVFVLIDDMIEIMILQYFNR